MKAEELRVGNIIKYIDKEIVVTTNVIYAVSKIVGESVMYTSIPLTTDRVLKFGFVSNNNFGGWGFKKGNMILFLVRYSSLFDEKEDFGFEIEYCAGNNFDDRTNIVRRIDFVHQLQNLYFALTEEELTL